MGNDGFEDIVSIGGYSDQRHTPRAVKRYWLFDTENGALNLPTDFDDTKVQSQGEE